MGQVLEALHRLQVVELQLAELRRERLSRERRVEHHKERVRAAEQRIEANRLAIRGRTVRLDALQLDISAREESIDKHRQALNKAKTNKEYAAILTAMNTEKADAAKVETEILLLMEEVQAAEEEATQTETEKATCLEDVARAEATLGQYDAKSKGKRDELTAQRGECAEHLEPTTLKTFIRVAEHHDGEAMVPVTKLHPKREEYMCGGCNMKLTLEIVNALHTRDELQGCSVCGRILYWDTSGKQRTNA